MPNLDFDAARRERQAARDPIQFKLGGKTFTCKPAIPFERLLDAMDTEGTVGDLFRHLVDFVASCLPPDQQDPWRKVVANPKVPVEETDVHAVAAYLTAVYAARPTSPPAGSAAGRRSNGRASSSTRTGRSPARKRAS